MKILTVLLALVLCAPAFCQTEWSKDIPPSEPFAEVPIDYLVMRFDAAAPNLQVTTQVVIDRWISKYPGDWRWKRLDSAAYNLLKNGSASPPTPPPQEQKARQLLATIFDLLKAFFAQN